MVKLNRTACNDSYLVLDEMEKVGLIEALSGFTRRQHEAIERRSPTATEMGDVRLVYRSVSLSVAAVKRQSDPLTLQS